MTELEMREKEALREMEDALERWQQARERLRRLERRWRMMAEEIQGLHREMPALEQAFTDALARVDEIQAQIDYVSHVPSTTSVSAMAAEIPMGR